ncbi:MBL fold metallo-hydrolase [Aquimarina sp. W85]|uniref:MBL fold metallo-hydrolase n=1 Tax=Aquimarina rhodophyticola TaxID=3342246 RepID=UPI00366C5DAE
MIVSIVSLIGVVGLIIVVFMYLSPQFGGTPSKDEIAHYKKSDNYKSGNFVNTNAINLNMSFKDISKILINYFKKQPNTIPVKQLTVNKIDSLNLVNYKGDSRLIWFGHSTFLLQLNKKTILIDPMFGDVPAPHSILGTKRFSNELPIDVEKLPRIDAVLISHDHYDHLDYGSIQGLKDKVTMFYVPLGLGVHLKKWGIDKKRIIELDWWQEIKFDDLTFICTPAQHFSGRGFTDRTKTLWSSWIIQSATENIFFSGDSGYAPHFKEIGNKYGPFDFAMMECGQYNEMWPDVHMFPEETVQAGLDIGAKKLIPIHWGAFKLAMHSWTDPVERITLKAKSVNMPIVTPKIGEVMLVNATTLQATMWWK